MSTTRVAPGRRRIFGLRRIPGLLAVLAAGGCGSAGTTDVVGPGCLDAARQWPLPNSIPEASGLGVSLAFPGIVWVLNDGDEAELRALRPAATAPRSLLVPVAIFDVAGPASDWEAMEVAPCDQGSCIWIADTGNNARNRDVLRLRRLAEPDPATAGSAGGPLGSDVFEVRYPDGRRDVEALFVIDGLPWLLSKGNGGEPPTLYRYPPPLRSGVVTLEVFARLSDGGLSGPDQITGAATVPGSKTDVLVRTYRAMQVHRLGEGSFTPVEGTRVNLTSLLEPQGEAVAIAQDGTVYLATEEGPTGGRGGLTAVSCSELGIR